MLALDLLGQIESCNLRLEVAAFNAALNCLAKDGGQWRTMLVLLNQIYGTRIQPDTITLNTAVCLCGALWQQALDVLTMMIGHEVVPDSTTWNSLATVCRKGNRA
eukprot:gnl/MRDRNA2_/MRDRNA2_53470_c0_seq1.p1 gnl/MRDRNA2_/MRDRNA2_53470_c0~~gnl/MRDRNA2_/MRDRNA2_53470_c0_seq1.p1  ORF type:complete len:105 (+),score=13.75 gnl/MRDRNA2_/MRDRNA2_53470_c0_seq1:152-466(+)